MLGVASKQHLAPLLLPVAVEAAWRLQRWPLLQDLLHQVKNPWGFELLRRFRYGPENAENVRGLYFFSGIPRYILKHSRKTVYLGTLGYRDDIDCNRVLLFELTPPPTNASVNFMIQRPNTYVAK